MIFTFYLFLFFISLFILFVLSKHDFVLLRKNISVGQIFDLAIVFIFGSLFFGRFFHILNSGQFDLISPIKFFYFFKFPGFSFLGFIVSGASIVYFYFRKTKALSRIYDIFALAFFPIVIASIAFFNYSVFSIEISFILLAILIGVFMSFLHSHSKYFMRDGNIALLTVSLFSFHAFVVQFFETNYKIILFSFIQWISLIIFFVSLGIFFISFKLFGKK
jgi:hypothetical protein